MRANMFKLEGKVWSAVRAEVWDDDLVGTPADVRHRWGSDFVAAPVTLGLAGTRYALCTLLQYGLI